MKPEYEQYRQELVEQKKSRCVGVDDWTLADLVRYECNMFTKQFVQKFPQLKRVAGFYGGPDWRTEHWWCVDVDGTVVDPTAEQFAPGGTYHPVDPEKDLVRIGRCMNCGDDIFGLITASSRCVCDDPECSEALQEQYGGHP